MAKKLVAVIRFDKVKNLRAIEPENENEAIVVEVNGELNTYWELNKIKTGEEGIRWMYNKLAELQAYGYKVIIR